MFDLTNLNQYKENNRLEVKKSSNGLPHSLWSTYSAFANTQGGIILLGVSEDKKGNLSITGLNDPESLLKEFWNIINNPQKVSINLLTDEDVNHLEVDGKSCIMINVPRAKRTEKPVYINDNLLYATFRRNRDGDYHCTKLEIQNMLRDEASISQDTLVIEEMDLSVFDMQTVARYRNILNSMKPDHVWKDLCDTDFLLKMQMIGTCQYDDIYHPTVAGLLLFGFEYEITKFFPNYFLDFQEILSDETRWTDRVISSSMDWSGNILEFFFKVYPRLTQDVKVPFVLDGWRRIEDTPIHKALREALANSLMHACYHDRRGLVIKRMVDEIRFENPGGLRISVDEAMFGGNSDPRNATIVKMFNLIDIGERAGSGLQNIQKTWEKEGFENPQLTEKFGPDRTILVLPLKLIGSKNRKHKTEAKHKKDKKKFNINRYFDQIMDYIEVNGECTRFEIEKLLEIKTSRASQLLKILTDEGKIEKKGSSRNFKYAIKH